MGRLISFLVFDTILDVEKSALAIRLELWARKKVWAEVSAQKKATEMKKKLEGSAKMGATVGKKKSMGIQTFKKCRTKTFLFLKRPQERRGL